jgi:membrane peptidoglycan carboxypeptidase
MPRHFPSLKRFLFKTHQDLATVCAASVGPSHGKLTSLEQLTLLLEDRRFRDHRGIDFRAIARESVKLISRQKHGGASTIEMQFVRTQTGYRQSTLRRKVYEMWLAFLLQYRMEKKEILRSYLSVVYLGTGLIGVKPTAYELFNKSLEQLSDYEAAFIVSLMVYPRPRSQPASWKQRVERRAAYGLLLLTRLGDRYE